MSQRRSYKWGHGAILPTIVLSTGSRDAQEPPTLASGDVQVSRDGGAFTDIENAGIGGTGTFGNHISVVPGSSVRIKVTLSDTHLECEDIMIRFKDAAGDEWDEQTLVLFADDIRLGKTEIKVPAGFVEHTGLSSQNIIRSGYPSYGVMYTDATSPLVSDFDPKLLLGGHILQEGTNSVDLVILGGYFWDDSENETINVFGIAGDTKFGCSEGDSVQISDEWTGATSQDTTGDGWCFIVQQANEYPGDGESLEIWQSEMFQAAMMIGVNQQTTEEPKSQLKLKQFKVAAVETSENAIDLSSANGNCIELNSLNGHGLKINVSGILKDAIHLTADNGLDLYAPFNNLGVSTSQDVWDWAVDAGLIESYSSSSSGGVEPHRFTPEAYNEVTNDIVNEVFGHVIEGTINFEKAQRILLAFNIGNINKVGNVYTYNDYTDSTAIFTTTITPTNRSTVVNI